MLEYPEADEAMVSTHIEDVALLVHPGLDDVDIPILVWQSSQPSQSLHPPLGIVPSRIPGFLARDSAQGIIIVVRLGWRFLGIVGYRLLLGSEKIVVEPSDSVIKVDLCWYVSSGLVKPVKTMYTNED